MPTVKELRDLIRDRAKRLAQAEKEAPPLPPGNGPGMMVLLGVWVRDAEGKYIGGEDATINEVWPDGRRRILRELPAGDFKMVLGFNPFDLV